MGSPAARLTDPTVHGGTIVIGLPTVLIGNQPAARIGDMHVCPMVTVLVPHVGGPLILGSFTVLTGGVPQSRVGDPLICVGPPDAVAMGCPTVLVGMAGGGLGFGSILSGLFAGLGNFVHTLMTGPDPNITVVQRGNITVIVDRRTQTITMRGTQEFSGDGASEAYATRITNDINRVWSGTTTFEGKTYAVHSEIQGHYRQPGDAATPGTNQINVVQTDDPPSVTGQNDPANQPYYGRDPGHQHSTEDSDGSVVAPHEFGHSMGLKDEYEEGPRNDDGTRNVVRTGPDGGLMGHIESGSKPTDDNYRSLITGEGLAD